MPLRTKVDFKRGKGGGGGGGGVGGGGGGGYVSFSKYLKLSKKKNLSN
jgi:hypothetical protein